MKKNTSGFTMIELMIVIAIIGILTSAALPAYSNYMAKPKVSEGMLLASEAKLLVLENFAMDGRSASADYSRGWSFPTSTKHVKTIAIAKTTGAITVTYTDAVDSKIKAPTLTLTPDLTKNSVPWACTTTLSEAIKPRACT